MILLSVVIPVFNDRDGLARLLALIPVVDWLEVVVIDDGSDCCYDDIVSSYVGKLDLLKQQNSRQGKARNEGLLFSKGKWVWFVDADDKVDESEVVKLFGLLESSDSDFLLFDAEVDGGMVECKEVDRKELIKMLVLNHAIVAPWNKIYSRSFLSKNSIFFPVKLKYEDLYHSLLSVFLSKKIEFVDMCLYKYYKNKGSTTNNHDSSVFDIFEVVSMIEKDIDLEQSDFQRMLFVHGIKYTIRRAFESRDIGLVKAVLFNGVLFKALNKIDVNNLSGLNNIQYRLITLGLRIIEVMK